MKANDYKKLAQNFADENGRRLISWKFRPAKLYWQDDTVYVITEDWMQYHNSVVVD